MRTESILVIPFADGIGDFVNVQPLLAVLRRAFPLADFTVAASEHGNQLVNDPAIEVVKPAGFNYEPGRMAVALRPLLPQKLMAWMTGPLFDRELGPFDLVINMFFAWERGMDFRQFWTPQFPPAPGAHHSLDYLADELERQLDIIITNEQRTPHLVMRQPSVRWASRFWTDNDLEGQRVVALVPSSNMMIKRWPVTSWLKLDAHLRERGVRTLLFCDKPDSEYARAFAAAGSQALQVFTTLDNVTCLLDVPWVGLFGPTNPLVTGPYRTEGGIALVAPFEKPATCGSCWKHFKYEDDTCRTLPAGSCMQFLQEDAVLEACATLLDRGRTQLAPPIFTYTGASQISEVA